MTRGDLYSWLFIPGGLFRVDYISERRVLLKCRNQRKCRKNQRKCRNQQLRHVKRFKAVKPHSSQYVILTQIFNL